MNPPERGTMSFKSTLPDPEHHPFFTEVEEIKLHKKNLTPWIVAAGVVILTIGILLAVLI